MLLLENVTVNLRFSVLINVTGAHRRWRGRANFEFVLHDDTRKHYESTRSSFPGLIFVSFELLRRIIFLPKQLTICTQQDGYPYICFANNEESQFPTSDMFSVGMSPSVKPTDNGGRL